MGGLQPARSLPQGLGEASRAPRRNEAIRAWGPAAKAPCGSWGSQSPTSEQSPPPPPPSPQRGHTTGNQEALRQVGKPQRREQEPGRFQSERPGLESTPLICKLNAK